MPPVVADINRDLTFILTEFADPPRDHIQLLQEGPTYSVGQIAARAGWLAHDSRHRGAGLLGDGRDARSVFSVTRLTRQPLQLELYIKVAGGLVVQHERESCCPCDQRAATSRYRPPHVCNQSTRKRTRLRLGAARSRRDLPLLGAEQRHRAAVDTRAVDLPGTVAGTW